MERQAVTIALVLSVLAIGAAGASLLRSPVVPSVVLSTGGFTTVPPPPPGPVFAMCCGTVNNSETTGQNCGFLAAGQNCTTGAGGGILACGSNEAEAIDGKGNGFCVAVED